MIRRGFTMIELTVAMLLASLLMLAVFQAFYLAARYRTLSVETHSFGLAMTNALHDLSSDLSAKPLPPAKGAPTAKNFSQASKTVTLPNFGSIRETQRFLDSFSAVQLRWVPFHGKRDSLAFRTHASNSRFTNSKNGSLMCDDCLVVWWVHRGSVPNLDAWWANGLVQSKAIPLDREIGLGLVRTQVTIDAQGKELFHSDLIAPDVLAMELQYYDGQKWVAEWDTTRQSRRPKSLGVRLQYQGEKVEHWIDLPEE